MPDGLYLTGVGYPAGFGIAAAADAARLTLWR
jgi:tRNA pseudouridine38-40 synthase